MNDVALKSTPRIEKERAARRRRDDLGDGRLRNLAVDGTKDPNYEYRWISAQPGRVHNLTKLDDWDVVTEADLGVRGNKDSQVGTTVERITNKADGSRSILVRKPRDYYVEDRLKAQRHLDEVDQLIKRGEVPAAGGDVEPRRNGVNAYVPAGGISIQDGRRS